MSLQNTHNISFKLEAKELKNMHSKMINANLLTIFSQLTNSKALKQSSHTQPKV